MDDGNFDIVREWHRLGEEEQQANGNAEGPQKPREPALIKGSDFIRYYQAPAYVVHGIIQRKRLYSLTGKTGAGKTAWALATAIELALQGLIIIYLAAENPDDVRGRLILMADRLQLDEEALDQIHFIEGGFDISQNATLIANKVKEIGGADLVIIDTAPAFMAQSGVEQENDNRQLYDFAMRARDLTGLPGGPAVIALCHPVKSCSSKDQLLPRGAGALLNEVDGNLAIWASDDRETAELHWCGKFRGPSFDPVIYAFETGTCDALKDADGNLIPTVWAFKSNEQQAEDAEERARSDEDALLLMISTRPKESQREWARYLGWSYGEPNEDGERHPNQARVRRGLKRLKEQNLAKEFRGRWQLTELGKKEIKG